MNIKEIKELIEIIDNSNLTKFEYENSGVKLTLKKENNVVIAKPTEFISQRHEFLTETEVKSTSKDESVSEKYDSSFSEIISPIVGVFYCAPAPDKDAFVKLGDKVKKGQVLCVVEAMKLMNEITAEYDCQIEKIMVNNEDTVEYGKPLFLVKPL